MRVGFDMWRDIALVMRMRFALPLVFSMIAIMLAAVVQQVLYPETGAWILVFIGSFWLVVLFAVLRLQKR